MKASNTWEVSLMCYGEIIITWKKDELKSMGRRTWKLMTMNKKLHPIRDLPRICVGMKKGGET